MSRRRALERNELRASRVATKLAEMLADLGITHRRLAEALSVSRYTVDSWTRAAEPALPGDESLAQLCAFLEEQQAGLGVELATAADSP